MPLYHREIGIPKAALDTVAGKKFWLKYSRHAMMEAVRDRYGVVNKPPCWLTVDPATVVEVDATTEYTGKWAVCKLVVRLEYDNRRDIIIVAVPSKEPDAMMVKTIWTNLRTDKHVTLQKEKYATISV